MPQYWTRDLQWTLPSARPWNTDETVECIMRLVIKAAPVVLNVTCICVCICVCAWAAPKHGEISRIEGCGRVLRSRDRVLVGGSKFQVSQYFYIYMRYWDFDGTMRMVRSAATFLYVEHPKHESCFTRSGSLHEVGRNTILKGHRIRTRRAPGGLWGDLF